jgi:hypothetical protein
MDAFEIRLGLLGVTLAAGPWDILPIDGRPGIIRPSEVMTFVTVVAGGGRFAGRHGPTVDTLLIQLIGVRNRDPPALH